MRVLIIKGLLALAGLSALFVGIGLAVSWPWALAVVGLLMWRDSR